MQKPRGTYDLFGFEAFLFENLLRFLRTQAYLYGCQKVITPMFEEKALFFQDLGLDSDVVQKECFVFQDRSQRMLALRPENTIGIIRCIVENKLLQNAILPLKLYYDGFMFRYERPQNQRYRQFYQFGIEYVSVCDWYEKLEILLFIEQLLETLQIRSLVKLKINYLASNQTRKAWIQALCAYFQPFYQQLSPISQTRLLQQSPLRILDDKNEQHKQFVIDCPKLSTFYQPHEQKALLTWQNLLREHKINFTIAPNLVRGLDYYQGLVFEYEYQQNWTLIGGGEYQSYLLADVASIGFALGLERLVTVLKKSESFFLKQIQQQYKIPFYLVFFQVPKRVVFDLIIQIRKANIPIVTDFNTNKINKHFHIANKLQPNYLLLLGPNELAHKSVVLKNQTNRSEVVILWDHLIDVLLKFL